MSNKPIQRINKSVTDGNVDLTPINRSISNLTEQLAGNATKEEIVAKANKTEVESLEAQLDQLVIEGDSSVEAAQARVDSNNVAYPTLKQRLDEKETEFSTAIEELVATINNLLLNGDFSEGSTGWTPTATTVSVANNILTSTSNGSANNPRISQNTNVQVVPRNKVFAKVKFRLLSEGISKLVCSVFNSNLVGNSIYAKTVSEPFSLNTEYELYGTLTVPSDWTGNYRLTLQHEINPVVSGVSIEISYASLIDLTAVFGKGNEPETESFNDFINSLPNGYINDRTLFPKNDSIKSFYSVDDYAPKINIPVNASWSGWQDAFYNYGFNGGQAKPPALVDGLLEVKGTIISTPEAKDRRWGYHIFEGWSTDKLHRLTMLIDKHPDYVEIYNYYQPPDGVISGERYKWVRIGSDVMNKGWDFSHEWSKAHTPLTWTPRTSDPTTMPGGTSEVPDGTMYYNSSLGKMRMKVGGIWKSIAFES